MAAWVLLRHTLPDGSWHHDWMVEDPAAPAEGGEGGGLITFRLDAAVAWPPRAEGAGGAFEGVRLAAHRREYLAFEGEISGGRGWVARVASGECGVKCDHGTIEVVWDGRCVTGWGPGVAGGRWRFEVTDGGGSGLAEPRDSRILRGTEPGDAGERSNR